MSRRIAFVLVSFFALPALAQPPQTPAPSPVAPKPGTAPSPLVAPQKSVKLDDPWATRTDLFVPPMVQPSTKVSLGAVQRFTLPNGLQVIAVPRKTVPVVDLTLAVRAGASNDPIGQSGLAQFTASMLRKGTQKRTSDQIAGLIDTAGGTLGASADDDGTLIGCHARARDFGLCLDLVSDVTMNPSFPDKEMGEIRDQLNATVDGARDNPSVLAAAHAANVYFGDQDPRGLPMSKKSLVAIDRDGLTKFHKTWFVPNNAVLAVSGDFDPAKLKGQLQKAFGGWKKATVPKTTERALPLATPMKVRFIDKPDATQSEIVIVGPGIKHADPDLYATRLMNYTLGAGSFSSRLMKVVRSEGGKTYGARSAFDTGRDPGTFTATTFTRNSETASTIKLILDEIERMRTGGVTDTELAAAKGNLIGGYGLHFETGSDVARQLLTAELDGLDPSFPLKYPENLSKMTAADALAAAQKHLKPQGLVVVGKAAEVKPLLAAAKLTPTETVSYLDPVSGVERAAVAQAKAAAGEFSPEEAEAGKKLLGLALKAKGADALAKVKELEMTGKGTMTIQGQSLPIAVQSWYLPNKAVREDIALGPGKVSQVFADGKGFMKEGQRVMDLPPAASLAMKRGMWRDGNFILLNAAQPGAKVRATGPSSLTVLSPDGESTQVTLDPKTWLVTKLVYIDDGKEARDDFGDYKTEGGIAFPRKVTHAGEGQKVEVTYDAIKVNKGVPPETFAR